MRRFSFQHQTPWRSLRSGGAERELEAIHAYTKALRELKGKSAGGGGKADETEQTGDGKTRAQRRKDAAAKAEAKKKATPPAAKTGE